MVANEEDDKALRVLWEWESGIIGSERTRIREAGNAWKAVGEQAEWWMNVGNMIVHEFKYHVRPGLSSGPWKVRVREEDGGSGEMRMFATCYPVDEIGDRDARAPEVYLKVAVAPLDGELEDGFACVATEEDLEVARVAREVVASRVTEPIQMWELWEFVEG
jgi:hypothetical protein